MMDPTTATPEVARIVLDTCRPSWLLVLIPALCSLCLDCLVTGGRGTSRQDLAKLQVDRMAHEYFPRWSVQHDLECDADLLKIGRAIDPGYTEAELLDPWERPLRAFCSDGYLRVSSAGEDREPDTADDIRSWRCLPH